MPDFDLRFTAVFISSNEGEILFFEINLGQFLRLIRAEFLVDAQGLNQVRGRPISVSTILETIKKTLD